VTDSRREYDHQRDDGWSQYQQYSKKVPWFKHAASKIKPVFLTRAPGLVQVGALLLLSLSGCAGNDPPPVDNSFCLYVPLPDPADAVNLKVRGNKVAILTNEQNFRDFCQLGDRSKSMGPR
jgi:hypothetical protein